MKHITLVIPTLLLSATLVACQSPPDKQQVGLVTGAVVGGVVGNAIGDNTAATIGGAAVGGLVGSQVGKNMDNKQ